MGVAVVGASLLEDLYGDTLIKYKMDNLNRCLAQDARIKGICKDGYKRIIDSCRDEAINFYLECPDWSIERGFPSLELLRREFADIEDKGVFVGKTFDGEVFDKLQAYIFHDCKGTIRVAMDYDNAVIPMLYFANGCRIRVECEQKNDPAINVPLYIAEDCKVVGAKADNCVFKRKTIKLIER